jgi:diadenosine tetraphosphate (Ap4A) HIT family hydrolase
VAKRIAIASGAENFNILQNNGRIAHQFVDHVRIYSLPVSWMESNVNVLPP